MAGNALTVDDARVEHRLANVGGGITYHYLLAKPEGVPVATVLLLHGWPDIGMGWRYQVPYLLSLNLQVVVPDMLGYGQTSAPDAAEEYSLKKMSAHLVHLVREVTDEPVILGGHDWGAALAWRMGMYYPELFRGVFSFCVPFSPPTSSVGTHEQFVKQNPIFQYQLQNSSGAAETIASRSTDHVRGFLNAMYGGETSEGLSGFDPRVGIIEDRLERINPSPLITPEMMDYYVKEFSRNGLHGPMNWYRTWAFNGEDELPLARAASTIKLQVPAMLVMAGLDIVLTPDMARGQENYFAAGFKSEVILEASHWVLIHCPDEVNRYIGEFVKQILG